jgi:hypothetical protein
MDDGGGHDADYVTVNSKQETVNSEQVLGFSSRFTIPVHDFRITGAAFTASVHCSPFTVHPSPQVSCSETSDQQVGLKAYGFHFAPFPKISCFIQQSHKNR